MNTPLLLAIARTLQTRATQLFPRVKKKKLPEADSATRTLRQARRALHDAYVAFFASPATKGARTKVVKAAAALHKEMCDCIAVLKSLLPSNKHDDDFYKLIIELRPLKPKDDGTNPIPPLPPAPSVGPIGPIGPFPSPVGPSDPGILVTMTDLISTSVQMDEMRTTRVKQLQAQIAQLDRN